MIVEKNLTIVFEAPANERTLRVLQTLSSMGIATTIQPDENPFDAFEEGVAAAKAIGARLKSDLNSQFPNTEEEIAAHLAGAESLSKAGDAMLENRKLKSRKKKANGKVKRETIEGAILRVISGEAMTSRSAVLRRLPKFTKTAISHAMIRLKGKSLVDYDRNNIWRQMS